MTGTTSPLPLRQADSVLVGALRPSPNHGERRAGARLTTVLLHYTGMPDGVGAIAWLCNPASEVSCHYVVDEAGGIVQLVAEDRRAWHAGRSHWCGETDLNSVSIGIEIVNPGHAGGLPPYPDAQIAAVTALCLDIAARQGVDPRRTLAHSDVAPGRKQDPGERFPWDRLASAGLGLWTPPRPDGDGPTLRPGDEGAAIGALQADLAGLGFGVLPTGVYDSATTAVVSAFQRHWRPDRVDGVFDPSTARTLADLLERAGEAVTG